MIDRCAVQSRGYDEVRKRMRRRSSDKAPSSASLPLATLRIGAWEDDVSADLIRGDAIMAAIFERSEADVEKGYTWAQLSSLFHPDDLRMDPSRHRHVREEGGLFVWEHRILPAPGIVRWVIARGYFERGTDGRMRGRGIVIDITDARMDGHVEGQSHFLTAYEASEAVLERIADRVLDIHAMVCALEAEGSPRLRELAEALLLELGRQIAASLPREPLRLEPPRNAKIH
ncbi:PAS domain-containing protein [Methylorubrum thiocyanatum]|uniref:PAS domain-containing protein n=1 Tax=Methylorubrum thiocyanatum TaxID=47958 RepID=UPI00383B1720